MDSGHVLLLDCTLSLVLRSFNVLPVVLTQACAFNRRTKKLS